MPTYLESVDTEWFNQRLVGVLVVVLAAFAVLGVRLIYLQIFEGRELRRLSEINSIRLQDIDAPRGMIYDRNGTTLVDNRPSFEAYIIPKDAQPLDQTLERLAALLDEPADDLRGTIQSRKKSGGYTPVLLREDIGRDTMAAIEVHKYELPGVVVRVSPKRHYIYGDHASHLLGYMGEISQDELRCTPYEDCKGGDYIGKFGIEKAYEASLRGVRGGRQVEVNATGQVVRVLDTVAAEPGRNIYLTIDDPLQKATEALLQDRAGAAVAVEPDTGRILAMASNPSFDPNLFVTGMTRDQWNELISNPFRPLENKATQAEYPPASTYKIVTAIAGLEEKVIDADTQFYCPGFYRYGNRVYRCWKRSGHGDVNLVKALAQSCDVYFYQVGEAVGVDRLARYAKAFGLGDPTGVALDREAAGLIPTQNWKLKRFKVPWQGGETLSIAIGQGFNLVTPLQMASLAATVGNGGKRFKPYVIEKIQTADGEIVEKNGPAEIGVVDMRPETLSLVRQALKDVVNDPKGTAYRSRIDGLPFSGKTGTAQVVSMPKGGELSPEEMELLPKDHAWFISYAPSESPTIAIAVIIEHGEHGSSAAAPVASAMIKAYLGDDLLAPDSTEAELAGDSAERQSPTTHSGHTLQSRDDDDGARPHTAPEVTDHDD